MRFLFYALDISNKKAALGTTGGVTKFNELTQQHETLKEVNLELEGS